LRGAARRAAGAAFDRGKFKKETGNKREDNLAMQNKPRLCAMHPPSLVDGREAALHVPQADQTQAGRGRGLAVVFVFEDPVD
jgi:hypothetical protein